VYIYTIKILIGFGFLLILMSLKTKDEIGKDGEQIAVNYLVDNGYTLLNQNWRYKKKEIDIIATINNYLVVVEVKTRTLPYVVSPEKAVTKKKQKNLIKAIEKYLIQYKMNMEVRFDIITITKSINKNTIEHIPNAFYPEVKKM